MANTGGVDYKQQFTRGRLHMIDEIASGDPRVGGALKTYADNLNLDRQSLHWQRTVRWLENIFFSAGRHYIDDLLVSKLVNSSTTSVGDLSIVHEAARNIPRPTNDFLGRYVETNVSLLTENRPRPRITSKSDRDEDEVAAELSELTLELLWESLQMPEKHREMVRLMLHCGTCWMEICYDPTEPKKVQIPKMKTEYGASFPEGSTGQAGITPTVESRQIPVLDEQGRPVFNTEVEYGEIKAEIVSPFSFHCPSVHYWNGRDMGWVMKEEYCPIDVLKDRYQTPGKQKAGLTKEKGWNVDVLNNVKEENITSLPLWWWQRITDLVEGPGTNICIGNPDYWEGYAVVRTLDRAPSARWPQGRTVITVGDEVLYDSPKKIGARAYDPRWPNRWHPYIRFRWEAQVGSIRGRSLISKLLPKVKRVNAIDTTLIMWRRTVPIAAWVAPKGTTVAENLLSGFPGLVVEYDTRRTGGQAPQPIHPPNYPATALQERETQIQEMESIAGTEEVLRGQRPVGVNSAMMIDVLRKQALASRSAILQAWDEGIQEEGSSLLQEVIRHIKGDARYAEQIRILAREKVSKVSIDTFSGADLSDNVQVRVDTVSLALVSKEARQARVLELLQYLPNLASIEDIGLRNAIIDELGLKESLVPSGPDIDRAKKMISMIKQGRFDRIVMHQEDDPYIFQAMLVNEMKSDGFIDLPNEQQQMLVYVIEAYKKQIELRERLEQQAMQQQMEMMAAMEAQKKGGGQSGG
jgi:hypothetical protein